MNKNSTFLIIFWFLLFNAQQSIAELPNPYSFSRIDIDNGLSHGSVNCFYKDSKGYMWIGTSAGLNRYDGYRIKIFNPDAKDSLSFYSTDHKEIFEDPLGNIWANTSHGINVFNPTTETFSKNQGRIMRSLSLPDFYVESIFKDKGGSYWFLYKENGISRYDPLTKKVTTLSHVPMAPTTISTNRIADFRQNSEGDYWVIHRNGVLEKLDGQSLKVIYRNYEVSKKTEEPLLHCELTIDRDDDLWIRLPEALGALYFNPTEAKFFHFHKESKDYPLNSNLVKSIVEDPSGMIWLGTDHGGINLVDKKDFSVKHILHNPELTNSLIHNSITTLYKDNEGIMWVGTFKNGVNYYHPGIIRFPHYKNLISDPNSLPYDDVNVFVEDKKGNIWLGTNGGGLIYMDRSANTFKRYQHDPDNSNSITSDVIVSLLYDKDNVLWIGTFLGGLNKFDGKTFTNYRNDPKNLESLANDDIWDLYQDSKGRIWIGTLRGGLDLFDPEKDTFINSRDWAGKYPLHCNYISAIAEDKNGYLWVGGGNGIDVFNPETGESLYFSHNAHNSSTISSNLIYSIYNDSENNIWIGTQEGLNLYNEKEQKFCSYTTKDGLPGNTIIDILEDDNQNLWVTTSKGLSHMVLNRSEKVSGKINAEVRNYNEIDGLQGTTFNENSAFRTSKGELIVGGANGFNIFIPKNLERNTNSPRIVFTNFELFNKTVPSKEEINGRVILAKPISETEHITLEHNENVFSIEFAALNFFQPEKNKYKYKMEGFDKEWHSAEKSNRRVTYTNLDPGTYTFKVIASNNDQVWNQQGSKLKITILTPFYKSTVAFVIYFILTLALLYFARYRILKNQQNNFQLEQERREANHLHNLDLMKIRFLTNVSHEFKTPLALILAPIEKLLHHTGLAQEHQQQFQMINRNARRLLNLVNQLLDFRKIEVDSINLCLSEGNVVKFIEESVYSFRDLSEKKNVSLDFYANTKEFQTSFDMDKLEKVLFNLLSNAFKFTPENGHITVEVNIDKQKAAGTNYKMLEISVRDTGIGFSNDKKELIFDRFYRNEVPNSMVNQGSGIGLSIVKEFVKIHDGTITVESEEGEGSCFIVKIPLKEITVSLPCKLTDVDLADSEEATNYFITENQDFDLLDNPPVILLIEDNEDFLYYLKENLSQHFKVVAAKNGKEGWQKTLSILPDLIVSDLMMPVMNGIELCKKIRHDSRTAHIPFILLTAHTSEEQKLKGLNIGASDYVTKPFSFQLLLSRIKNLIKQRQSLQKVFEKKISVQTTEVEITSVDGKFIQDATKIIEDNISNPDFSVEDLASQLGVSRTYLYNKTVALVERSPLEFIRKIRLERGAQLLEKSQLTIAEIAFQVGFNNAKYFTKYFKMEFNMLPSAYVVKNVR